MENVHPITIKREAPSLGIRVVPPVSGEKDFRFIRDTKRQVGLTLRDKRLIEEHYGTENVVWFSDPDTGEKNFMVKGDEYPA